MTSINSHSKIRVFFSYVHEDEELRNNLANHLALLERQGLIQSWHDRQILAGVDWQGQIDSQLEASQIFLLLISANFLASDYCYDVEMKRALEKHIRGEACVIPIILRPVDNWKKSQFGKLKALPENGVPVTSWKNQDEAFAGIVQGIRLLIEDLKETSHRLPPTNPETHAVVQRLRSKAIPRLTEKCRHEQYLDLEFIPQFEALRAYGKMILVGEAGSGKSTYTKYLAGQCISGNIFKDYLPVLVDLKEFSDASSTKKLLEFISQIYFADDHSETKNCSLHRFISPLFHEALFGGKVIFLLDGINYIKDSKVFDIIREIRDLVQVFSGCKYCLTCQLNDWKLIKKKYKSKAVNFISENFEEVADTSYIDNLTQKIRDQIRSDIQDRCGTMQILDMSKPVGLTDIYTSVNVLEQITGRRRKDIAELLSEANIEDFDRFGLGVITEKRVPGLEVVSKYARLMILGKPGAGKTTFLKYVAIQCNNNQFLRERLPIFVTLKDYAEAEKRPSIIDYISQQFSEYGISQSQISMLIKYGRALVLFDGLDEVREEDSRRVINQIQDFSKKFSFSSQFRNALTKYSEQLRNYSNESSLRWLSRELSDSFYINYIVITCRIAAREYVFENFTEVEVADFDDDQIFNFASNWFRGKPIKVDDFINRIDKNKRIKQIAANPLLLTLLCLAFEESGDFPINRSELYKEGLDALLKKWDAKRGIQRVHFYKKLSVQRKEELLGNIALITFEKKDYFFKKRDVEEYITSYICDLPNANTDPSELLLDSEEILRLIVAQHGLLLERAVGIYSFSHLTFHEYFVARELVFGQHSLDESVSKLASFATEKRWREVFLLAVEMLRKADLLLNMMKENIDNLISKSRKIQTFLKTVSSKSKMIKSAHEKTIIRASYISGMTELDYGLAFELAKNSENITHNVSGGFSISNPLELEDQIRMVLNSARNLKQCYIPKGEHDFILNAERFMNNLSAINPNSFEEELGSLIKKAKEKIPKIKKAESFEEWWLDNGIEWSVEWESILNYFVVQEEFNFSAAHRKLLKQYYDANMLLIECLNSDCYVTLSCRVNIRETLLLPDAELKKFVEAY